MKQCLLFIIMVVFASLAVGCGSPAKISNPTPTAHLVPVSLETPKAANTVEPVATPPAIAETSTAMLDVTATSAAIAQTVVAASQPEIYASYPSPDNKWRVEVITYNCIQTSGAAESAYEQLKLIEVSSRTETIIDSQLYYCSGLGAYGLGGLSWSPNSRYFYYTSAREGSPDGCGYWERPVIRFDTIGQSRENLEGGAISPDRTKIALWQKHEIVVWDLDWGEIARTSTIAPTAKTGPIVWSPDSQALVYVQTASTCPFGTSYVVRLDLPEFTSTLLVESETYSFIDAAWSAAGQLRLFDEQRKEWRFDFATKKLEPVP